MFEAILISFIKFHHQLQFVLGHTYILLGYSYKIE